MKRYYNEADRSTPYHYHRNMNKKIHSNILMLKTHKGKLLIERAKIDKEVHEHFKEKFQSKQHHLDQLPDVQEEEEIPSISE